jgi:hypothetical protein
MRASVAVADCTRTPPATAARYGSAIAYASFRPRRDDRQPSGFHDFAVDGTRARQAIAPPAPSIARRTTRRSVGDTVEQSTKHLRAPWPRCDSNPWAGRHDLSPGRATSDTLENTRWSPWRAGAGRGDDRLAPAAGERARLRARVAVSTRRCRNRHFREGRAPSETPIAGRCRSSRAGAIPANPCVERSWRGQYTVRERQLYSAGTAGDDLRAVLGVRITSSSMRAGELRRFAQARRSRPRTTMPALKPPIGVLEGEVLGANTSGRFEQAEPQPVWQEVDGRTPPLRSGRPMSARLGERKARDASHRHARLSARRIALFHPLARLGHASALRGRRRGRTLKRAVVARAIAH